MAREWYYIRAGKTQGPVSGQELQQLSASGELTPDDLVWREGMVDWMPARSLGLLGGPVPVRPPPVPVTTPVTVKRRHSRTAARPRSTFPWPIVVVLALVAVAGSAAIGWQARSLNLSNQRLEQGSSERPRATRRRMPAPETARSRSRREAASSVAPHPGRGEPTESKRTALDSERPVRSRESAASTSSSEADEYGERFDAEPEAAPSEDESSERAAFHHEDPPITSASPRTSDQQSQQQTWFQEITVERQPVISVQGIPLEQRLRYHVHSRLEIGTAAGTSPRAVQQEILSAELEQADDMSRLTYENMIRKLKGRTFTYQVTADGEVEDFKGFAESRDSKAVARDGDKGYLLTSLIDEDGWKELTRLTFFRPSPQRASADSWQEQMTHNWGPLGRWTGLTTFTEQPQAEEPVRQFGYRHAMTYEPPRMADASLGFRILTANFEPLETGGVIHYDPQAGRISTAEERFHVRGTISTEVLGQPAEVALEELQILTIRLSDQSLR